MSKAIVINFGRYQGVHNGHEMLIDFMRDKAAELQCEYRVFPSSTHDKKNNPIPFDEKLKMMQTMLPEHASCISTEHPNTIVAILQDLEKSGYTDVYFVCGSDRAASFEKFLPNYNGLEYQFDVLEILSAGKSRNDGIIGAIESSSASKIREYVKNNDITSYIHSIPINAPIVESAKIFNKMRGIFGEIDENG